MITDLLVPAKDARPIMLFHYPLTGFEKSLHVFTQIQPTSSKAIFPTHLNIFWNVIRILMFGDIALLRHLFV